MVERLDAALVPPPLPPHRARVFKPYGAPALSAMVAQRVGPHLIHPGALALLHKKVEAGSGSARDALALVQHAVSAAAADLTAKENLAASDADAATAVAWPLVTMQHMKAAIAVHTSQSGGGSRAAAAKELPPMAQVTQASDGPGNPSLRWPR